MIRAAAVGPCKEWAGYRNPAGYGVRQVKLPSGKRKQVYVHRHAWAEAHGRIRKGMCVCHRCDNPACYELTHLFLGTRGANNRDAARKGRSRSGRQRLTEAAVASIREEFWGGSGMQLPRLRALAEKHGMSWNHVYGIVHRIYWKRVA